MIAITGRSGSGKSQVSEYYRNRGFQVCDADLVARQVLQPPSPCLQLLAERFGQDIFKTNGELNRRLLADRAFATSEGTQALTDITHPEIIRRILEQQKNAAQKLFFVDGAVIVGHRLQQFCDKIILVTTEQAIAIQRICSRDGISAEMAKRRLDAQTPESVLKDAADYIICNNTSTQELYQQAAAILKKLTDEDFYEETIF